MTLLALVPYLRVPELIMVGAGALGNGFPPQPISIKPFGALVALGVTAGAYLAMRRARRGGLSERVLGALVLWVVVGGFVGGHVLDTVFYYPERVWTEPWSLLMLWDGQSSFGGFAGAALGTFWFAGRYRIDVWPYADAIASALPTGWFFGRMGCAVVHDHPGLPSDLWFAVAYPHGGRLDLGLLEMVTTLPLALAFIVLGRRPRPVGFYLATMTLGYAPIRFSLDFLRAAEEAWPDVRGVDPRYGWLTPAQWGCLVLLLTGVWLYLRLARTVASEEWVASMVQSKTARWVVRV